MDTQTQAHTCLAAVRANVDFIVERFACRHDLIKLVNKINKVHTLTTTLDNERGREQEQNRSGQLGGKMISEIESGHICIWQI